jgi:hypothetical protein
LAALEYLDDNGDINRVLESVIEDIKISGEESLGYCELKNHKLWFDEGSSKELGKRKRAKLQWLQDPSQISRDNLNCTRSGATRHFRKKKRGY